MKSNTLETRISGSISDEETQRTQIGCEDGKMKNKDKKISRVSSRKVKI